MELDFPIILPDKSIDMPIKKLNSNEWSSIALKSVQSAIPTMFYDNGDYPLRKISLWPVPSQAQEIRLWLWEPLFNFDDLDAEVALPKGYERALRFNLAVEVAPEFGKEIAPQVKAIANQAKSNLKRLNAPKPQTVGDASIAGTKSGYFNWITGEGIPH